MASPSFGTIAGNSGENTTPAVGTAPASLAAGDLPRGNRIPGSIARCGWRSHAVGNRLMRRDDFSPQAFETDRSILAAGAAPGRNDDGKARPTVEKFLRHARLFGVEGVHETASELLPDTDMESLLVELHAVAADHRKARKPEAWWQGLPKLTKGRPNTRANQIRALREAGRTPQQVAAVTGAPIRTVMRIFAE